MSVDTVVFGVVLAAVGAALYFVFASFLFGAGYQPTPSAAVDRMLDLARVGPDDTLYDLGAGTGAIVFRAARERGARAVAVEVEPLRVLILNLRRWFGGPRSRVRVLWRDHRSVDLAPASVIAVFLWPGAMERLRERIEREVRPGVRVVSYYHPITGWTPDAVDTERKIYLYGWPARSAAPHP